MAAEHQQFQVWKSSSSYLGQLAHETTALGQTQPDSEGAGHHCGRHRASSSDEPDSNAGTGRLRMLCWGAHVGGSILITIGTVHGVTASDRAACHTASSYGSE